MFGPNKLLSTSSRYCQLNAYNIFFKNYPQGKDFLPRTSSKLGKYIQPCKCSLSENYQKRQTMTVLGVWGFERASALVCFFKAIRLLLVFTLNASYFIRLLWSWRVGDVTRTITVATKLTVLTYQPLFLNKHSLDGFKPLFNFWSYEKADSDIIC